MVARWFDNMQIAADLARRSLNEKRKSYFGAVIATKNRILGRGVNSTAKHPFLQKHYPRKCNIHAEAAAIIHATRIGGDIRGMDLFVTRVFRSGEIAPDSKPCSSCMSLIARFGLRRVFFIQNGVIKSLMINGNKKNKELGTIYDLMVKD